MKIFNKENIIISVDITEKDLLLKEIAKKICDLGYGKEEEEIYEGLKDRENDSETALGDGFAIPHTKSSSILTPGVLFVKTIDEIKWSAEESANVFIVLFTPLENKENIHLKMLSSLSRKLINSEFKDLLHSSEDVEVLFQNITNALAN